MSVVNHFEISLRCLLHCMYYDITTNNKLIVFGRTLIGQFQVYNIIIQSQSALIMILQSARSLLFTAANCYGRTQEAQFPPLVHLIVSVSDNNYGHSILDQELWNLYSMYKILWTETPTKLLYTDFVHILDCQVEYFISMCELWDLEHFLHTEFFLHYFSLFLSGGRKFTSLPHLQLYCGYL